MKNLLMVIIVLLGLVGCASFKGAGVVNIPTQVINNDSIVSLSKKYTQAICTTSDSDDGCSAVGDLKTNSWLAIMKKCQTATSSTDKQNCKYSRNIIVNELLLIIDHNYHSYEGGILAGRAKTSFYTGALRTSFETAATLMTPVDTVKILAGLATFTGALQSSADKEFYFEQTIHVLVTQMRTDRKVAVLSILKGLKLDYEKYSLEYAIRHIGDYYRAGTIASSVISLSQGAAKSQEVAQENLDKEN